MTVREPPFTFALEGVSVSQFETTFIASAAPTIDAIFSIYPASYTPSNGIGAQTMLTILRQHLASEENAGRDTRLSIRACDIQVQVANFTGRPLAGGRFQWTNAQGNVEAWTLVVDAPDPINGYWHCDGCRAVNATSLADRRSR
jgi:hypothetical protein